MFLLEPVACLLRLALLKYKARGTKIGIDATRVYLVEPWNLQGVFRWYQGSSRDDLYFLLQPILRARHRLNNPADLVTREILRSAALGLIALKKTYEADGANTTSQAIALYVRQLVCDDADLDEVDDADGDGFAHQVYAEYFKLWTKDQLSLAVAILKQCELAGDPTAYVNALSAILNDQEMRAKIVLHELTRGLVKKSNLEKRETQQSSTKK